MKKITYILVLSLLLWNVSCSQNSENAGKAGYGDKQGGLENDAQTGAGQVDNSEAGAGANANGGTMNNTRTTDDTLHTPDRVGETRAAAATERTQTEVGNSNTTDSENHSKSRTTKNKVIK